jgi:hypothetical protein
MGAVTKGVEAVKSTFSFFQSGEKVASAVQATEKVAETGGIASKAIAATARVGQKVLPKPKVVPPAPEHIAAKAAPIATEKVAETGVKAAGEVAPKVAKKTVTKIGKDKLASILSKKLPSAFSGSTLGKLIPGIGAALGLGFAVSRLVKGDLVGAALEGISGFGGAATAIPAIVAQLVRDVYQEAYGVFPEKDPMSAERLPELAEVVKQEAASWLKGSKGKDQKQPLDTPTASAPKVSPEHTENIVGPALAKSTAKHKELVAMATPSAPSQGSSSINVNNIQNMKSSTVFAPGMPSSRSQDSSYLRSMDNALP